MSPTPIVDALRRLAAEGHVSLHMPGHKQGTGTAWADRWPDPALAEAARAFGREVWALDQSEIGGFDYLHAPEGAIAESQALTAELFGVDRTFFLVNGSTVGNLAAIVATCGDGDLLVMGRASHRSVYGALLLSGARGLYVPPAWHDGLNGWFGVDVTVARELGERALATGQRIGAVHVTNPSYFGFAPDLPAWRALANDWNVPLIVDEAHGTHLRFDSRLPASGTTVGADVVVQSPHKTAGSLTQASWMHVSGSRIDGARVASILGQIQSSSPSSLLTGSLDLAQAQLTIAGAAMIGHAVDLSLAVRSRLHERFSARVVGGGVVIGEEAVRPTRIAAIDVTKLVINAAPFGCDGYGLARALADRRLGEVPVRAEFADIDRIVCSVSWADDELAMNAFVDALAEIDVLAGNLPARPEAARPEAADAPGTGGSQDRTWRDPEAAMTVREASIASTTAIPWAEASGRISADYLIPYPPGIPAVVPGERFDDAVLASIARQHRLGARVVGVSDPALTTLRVTS
jgi:arginine decarboxylase